MAFHSIFHAAPGRTMPGRTAGSRATVRTHPNEDLLT